MAACPSADPADEAARELCADNLADSEVLRTLMGSDLLWGGHTDHPSFDPVDHHLTRFNSRIFRKMYLSTFTFGGEPKIWVRDGFTLLSVESQFRNDLGIGSYPYPFWHSEDKWNAYEVSTHLIVVLSGGRIVAMYRAGDDASPERVDHTWDGAWTWTDPATGDIQPRVSLYSYVLSPENPHAGALDDAYRALETAFREQTCLTCHAPDNAEAMPVLHLLTYPNQALGERHALIDVLERNVMPPATGVEDEDSLEDLVAMARTFADIGDEALLYEGEPQ